MGKSPCKYGSKCYRKNTQHIEEFSHPDREDEEPKRKKAKIDDFFKAGNSKSSDVSADETGDAADDATDDTEEDTAAESPQKDADEKVVGESSGYVRAADSDSEEETTDSAPLSPEDIRENIKSKFLVEMPEDFYDFWEFAKTVNKKNPCDAFKSTLGLRLVGPYDILAGKHKDKKAKASYLRHWRYYYDPPEFQTVIRGDDATQFHMGYFRDDPNESPVFLASNAAKENCTISPRGENIFAAVHWFISDKMKKEKTKGAPLGKLKQQISDAASKDGYLVDEKTKTMKARDKKSVCKTFHGAGLVVPVDENEVGYRPVPETPGDLKKMFKKIVEAKTDDDRNKAMDPLMEIVMLVQFANDECDYGEGLELGLDLFSYGGKVFHKLILNLIPLAYQLLRRPQFGQIIQSHFEDRKHSANLSVLE